MAQKVTAWVGWVWFAAFAILVSGLFNIISGAVAVFSPKTVLSWSPDGVAVVDVSTWGWVQLALGLLLLLVGFALFSGAGWARVVRGRAGDPEPARAVRVAARHAVVVADRHRPGLRHPVGADRPRRRGRAGRAARERTEERGTTMTTFTAWKFDTADGAQKAVDGAEGRAGRRAGQDRRPRGHQLAGGRRRSPRCTTRTTTSCAAPAGAPSGACCSAASSSCRCSASRSARRPGRSPRPSPRSASRESQLDEIRAQITAGTSLLCAVTENADMDRLGERHARPAQHAGRHATSPTRSGRCCSRRSAEPRSRGRSHERPRVNGR